VIHILVHPTSHLRNPFFFGTRKGKKREINTKNRKKGGGRRSIRANKRGKHETGTDRTGTPNLSVITHVETTTEHTKNKRAISFSLFFFVMQNISHRSTVFAIIKDGCCLLLGFLLLLRQRRRQPVEPLIQAVTGRGRRALDVPLSVAQLVQSQALGHLLHFHGVG